MALTMRNKGSTFGQNSKKAACGKEKARRISGGNGMKMRIGGFRGAAPIMASMTKDAKKKFRRNGA